MRVLRLVAAVAVFASGCSTVDLKSEHEARIDQYRREGKLAQASAEVGYTVNPTPTFFWALLPGANQVHIARKITQSPYYGDFARDYPWLTSRLTSEGVVCLIFSWIPWVYEFSMPCQMGSGVFPDVARVNNLAYMYHLDAQKKSENKSDAQFIGIEAR